MAPRKGTTRTARSLSGAKTATTDQGIGMRKATDGLTNVLTGLGGEKDKLFNTHFGIGLMDRFAIDAAYRGDWIARKGIDIPAFDSTREWREWQAEKDDVSLIEDVETKFSVQLKTMKAMALGRLYGGGALVLGVDQGNPEEELDIEAVGLDDLKFVHVVSRFELNTGEIEWDITSPYYGRPKYYEPVQRNSNVALQVRMHPSRIIPFIGNEIPDPGIAQGWGDSVLQSVSDAVMSAGLVSSSTAQMVSEAKLDVIKIPGLSENIINADYEANLKKRFATANMAKSVYGIILLDALEEWERINAQFAGLPDVLKMYLLTASGAFDVPATRFLSQSPAGLSATGESDTRNYYDRLSTEQKVFIAPAIRPMDKIILRSALGDVPEDEMKAMWYQWRPLWQMNETERNTVTVQKANAFKIDVDAGLMNEVVLKKAREAQLIADGTYPGLQQIIDEFDDDPNLEQKQAQEAELQAQMASAPPVTDPNDPNYDPTKDPNSPDFAKPTQTPPQQVPNAKSVPPSQKKQPPKKTAPPSKTNGAAADGMRRRIADATRPRSLYVRRDVVNSREIEKWAKSQGFASVIPDMHVTVLYSKSPVYDPGEEKYLDARTPARREPTTTGEG
jgi:phage-related protein (TIGR01555 family)